MGVIKSKQIIVFDSSVNFRYNKRDKRYNLTLTACTARTKIPLARQVSRDGQNTRVAKNATVMTHWSLNNKNETACEKPSPVKISIQRDKSTTHNYKKMCQNHWVVSFRGSRIVFNVVLGRLATNLLQAIQTRFLSSHRLKFKLQKTRGHSNDRDIFTISVIFAKSVIKLR